MADTNNKRHLSILQRIARRMMLEKGFHPDFSSKELAELAKIHEPVLRLDKGARDLRDLLWCSIDNDDSLDLDQLTASEARVGGITRIFVAIADVDAAVPKQSALDGHARHNTTSVYTAGGIFPMLPEKLSNGLTSLNLEADRPAMVVEMDIGADGSLRGSDIYEAVVRNRAKLSYNNVAAWLDGGAEPQAITAVNGLADSIRLQDSAARKLKALRHEAGALELETIETRPIFEGEELKGLAAEEKNRAKDIIEDFMIAANGITARFLASRNFSSVRRVVRVPKRWDRIIELAKERGFNLPAVPDSKALDTFLEKQKTEDPLSFPDISLSVIKLLGAGEYILERPGDSSAGHFGLAVKDYAHSTAPNRRFPDLITQRLLKAAVAKRRPPYADNELKNLGQLCTEMEDMAKKVERQVEKSAAALLLERRIGQTFDTIVTGVSDKGTWVRVLDPPVEGKLVSGSDGLDVGNRIKVRLARANVQRGFIDFTTGKAQPRQNTWRWKKSRRRKRR